MAFFVCGCLLLGWDVIYCLTFSAVHFYLTPIFTTKIANFIIENKVYLDEFWRNYQYNKRPISRLPKKFRYIWNFVIKLKFYFLYLKHGHKFIKAYYIILFVQAIILLFLSIGIVLI